MQEEQKSSYGLENGALSRTNILKCLAKGFLVVELKLLLFQMLDNCWRVWDVNIGFWC